METHGDLEDIKVEQEIEWKIPEYSSLSSKNCTYYSSSYFWFCNESWHLRIYPNGCSTSSVGYVSLILFKNSSGPPKEIECSFGLKTLSGQKYFVNHFTHIFTNVEGFGYHEYRLRSHLSEKKAELLPADVLTVFCSLKLLTSVETPATVVNISKEKCTLCGKIVETDLSIHQKKDKTVKCGDCSAVLTLQNWCDHKCQSERTDCQPKNALITDKFMNDFETLLNGDFSDVVIKVEEEEFRLHRYILAARSSYFYSMFKSEMKEDLTGIVTIKDCEPDVFQAFIHFLYSGKLNKLTLDNVCQVYEIADKYQEKHLKQECLNLMLNSFSVHSFCNYFQLALKYDIKELFQKAVEYFISQAKEICRRVEWQTFAKEYPIQANELFLKTLDHYVK